MKCNAGADAGRGVLLLCVLAMILAVANHRAHSPPASAGYENNNPQKFHL
jgi:hypothetical protein